MTSPSTLPPELLQAYRETHYKVFAQGISLEPFALQIGAASSPLSGLHKHFGVDCSAFITAWNPWGKSLLDKENAARHDGLIRVVSNRSLRWLEGSGEHLSNQWPAERSMLILGLSLAAAKVLAEDYEQNAFVWSGVDAKPQLVSMR